MKARRVDRDTVAVAICIVGLGGMAYCHLRDVGMKLDEHVYYMATLFCCNIAASVLLIPALVLGLRAPVRRRRQTWLAAGGLAALTIVGFLWSRTVGFPQMQDHVGEWDSLGVTSVAFETAVMLVSAWRLAAGPLRTSSVAPVLSLKTGRTP